MAYFLKTVVSFEKDANNIKSYLISKTSEIQEQYDLTIATMRDKWYSLTIEIAEWNSAFKIEEANLL